jgi:hypothetical protein
MVTSVNLTEVRLCGRLEPRQRRPQRIKPRGVGILVVLYEAPDGRGDSGQLVFGKVNCRHGRNGSARPRLAGLRAGKAYAKIDEAAKIPEEAAARPQRSCGPANAGTRSRGDFTLSRRGPGVPVNMLL